MAKYPLYAVRDLKVGFEPQILLDMNDATALRGFGFQCNNKNAMRNYAPADYELHKIGYFDTESGQIESTMPEFIASGVNVLNEK